MVRVLEKVKASMSPLRGVVHAAGVLDDGILLQQDWERFTGNGPKGKRLESAYIDPEAATDFFVVFSSAASLLGSPSRKLRSSQCLHGCPSPLSPLTRLPGLSINWGPWGDAGMAASLSSRYQLAWLPRD